MPYHSGLDFKKKKKLTIKICEESRFNPVQLQLHHNKTMHALIVDY